MILCKRCGEEIDEEEDLEALTCQGCQSIVCFDCMEGDYCTDCFNDPDFNDQEFI